MQPIGTLGGPTSTGNAINDAGRVAGSSFLPQAFPGDNHQHAIVYDPGVGITDLGTLGGDGQDAATARGVNASGVVAGGSSLENGTRRAFTWRDGAFTVLPLHPRGTGADAHAINDAGIVVGTAELDGVSHAAKWENGVITSLGAVDPARDSEAVAISNNGIIVGTSSTFPDHTAATLFLGNGEVVELPRAGRSRSSAYGVNSSGQIVGEVSGDLPRGAVIWQNNQIQFLEPLVGDPTLRLFSAHAINDAGQIAASGFRGTEETTGTYLLTPVPCSTERGLKSIETQFHARVDLPATAVAGDILLATFEYDDDPNQLVAPIGWTKLADQVAGAGTEDAYHAVVYAHRVTTTEPASYQFDLPGGVWIGTTVALYGGVSSVAAVASSFADDSNDVVAPSVTAAAGDLLVTFVVDWAGGTWTGPAGSTWRAEFAGNALFDTVVTSSGPTGPRPASNDVTSDLAAVSIVLH